MLKMKTNVTMLVFLMAAFFCNIRLIEAVERNNLTCGITPGKPLINGYGPFDFTNPEHQSKLPIVLGAHFTPKVERLIDGETGALPHDIDYTLRAIPNYHRALNAISRFEILSKKSTEQFSQNYSADCFFKRAIYFQPADATTRMLYGMHKHQLKNLDEAEALYLQALAISPKNPEIHYNLGLLYVDKSVLDKAKKHAKVAYAAGYPLPGLNNKIARAEKAN